MTDPTTQPDTAETVANLRAVGMEYEVHPTNWPMCIRSPRGFVE